MTGRAMRSNARITRGRVSYRETTSPEDSSSSDGDSPAPKAKRRRVGRAPQSRASTKPTDPPKPARETRTTTAKSTPSKQPKLPSGPIVIASDGKVPSWSSLPYEILLAIFKHASPRLRSADLGPLPAIGWLVSAARTCRAFREPALSALYESPPIYARDQSHDLLRVLKRLDPPWTVSYPAKVKRLEIDAVSILSYSTHGLGHLEIIDLIAQMPLLEDLIIVEPTDRSPYRQIARGNWWTYPQPMFEMIDNLQHKRKAWHWNALLLEQNTTSLVEVATWMTRIHGLKCHQTLQKLSFSHFGLDKIKKRRNAPRIDVPVSDFVGALGRVLAPLQDLRSLSLVSCLTEKWHSVLSALPRNLTHLSIINTQTLSSADLTGFLATHGAHLLDLTLNHNQYLDLRFLPSLRQSCPKLQRLYMDLTFYSAVASYKDDSPLFDTLLTSQDKPTWPTCLESLELLHMRRWDQAAAETFFASLVDASTDLPYLRTIVLKAILSIGWRDRAGFRDKWIGLLRNVFLRKYEPPNPYLATLKTFRLWKELPTQHTAQDAAPNAVQSAEPDTSASATSSKRRTRTRRNTTPPPKSGNDHDDERTPEKPHIQGLCTTVDIIIDNLRPSEVQFTEGDFLDSERSGDEDWNSGTEESDAQRGERYAW